MMKDKIDKQTIIKEFGHDERDTGSIEVQVAILTRHIRLLTDHCKTHPKDYGSKRGLLRMVCKRRSCLQYLARKDQEKYKDIVRRLELRK